MLILLIQSAVHMIASQLVATCRLTKLLFDGCRTIHANHANTTVEVANSFALVGLDRLERNFPILNQSTDEVGPTSSFAADHMTLKPR